jgi:hypothetical protein
LLLLARAKLILLTLGGPRQSPRVRVNLVAPNTLPIGGMIRNRSVSHTLPICSDHPSIVFGGIVVSHTTNPDSSRTPQRPRRINGEGIKLARQLARERPDLDRETLSATLDQLTLGLMSPSTLKLATDIGMKERVRGHHSPKENCE